MIRFARSTLCFTRQRLFEVPQGIAQLGFHYVDVGVQHGTHASALEVVQSGASFAGLLQCGLKRANIELDALRGATVRA